ncbi:hypothetical protein, partial [Acinetobacter baumannii]
LITYPGGSSVPNPLTWLDNVESVAVDGRTWSYDFKGIHYAGDLESSSAMRATDPTGAITSLDMPLWRDPPARIADPLGRAT